MPRRSLLILALVLGLVVTGAASAEFPTFRSGPSVIGIPQEGQTLNGQTGQWLFSNGLKCTECAYRYTWQRCNADASGCADIPGATGYTYTLGAADVGKRVRFVEWIRKVDCNALGQDCRDIEKNGASWPTDVVRPKPVLTPVSTAPPTVQGVAMEDEILRATGGTWNGPGTIAKTMSWQRCNGAGEACATIAGATGAAYRLTAADIGSRIRALEAATNAGGTAYARSAPTAVVVELRPTAARPTIPVEKVTLPHRLVVDRVITRQSGTDVTVKIRVSDDRGFRITGVLVKATPTGLLSGSSRERKTDSTGWATFKYRATGSGTTFVYAQAHRKGEQAQSGISSANLFRIRVRG